MGNVISKKRKTAQGRKTGRYTPPQRRTRFPDQGSAGQMLPAEINVHPSISDPRSPVTFDLGDQTGHILIPLAFAEWLTADGLADHFAEFVVDCQNRQVHVDMFAAFLTNREVPDAVVRAIEQYPAFMDTALGTL